MRMGSQFHGDDTHTHTHTHTTCTQRTHTHTHTHAYGQSQFSGHELLLGRAADVVAPGGSLVIGVTGDAYLRAADKGLSIMIEPVGERMARAVQCVRRSRSDIAVVPVELDDPYGTLGILLMLLDRVWSTTVLTALLHMHLFPFTRILRLVVGVTACSQQYMQVGV